MARGAVQHFLVSLVVALGAACPALGQDRQGPIKIGVLAKRGAERCLAKWGPTAQYLTGQIPEHSFIIVPLGYGEVCPAVDRGEVDFVLANPFVHVEIEDRYGASALATLISLHFGVAYTSYGGAIFHRAGRNDIKCLADLKGKTFMAVAETSFGGWLIAWREMKEQGIDPHRDFADLRFGGTHDAVVYAVREGKADAGTVRTDTLERMESEGKTNLRDFSVIRGHLGSHVHHPFLHSTRSYPEWPFAKVKHTSDGLAQQVAVALLGMPVDSPAAKAACCAGWAVPHNYQAVHECLKELRVGPYQDYGKITLGDVLRRYWVWIASVAVLLAGMAVTVVWALRLLAQRKRAEEELRGERDKLKHVFEAMDDGVYIVNQDYDIEYVNPVLIADFGPYEGRKCYAYFHDREEVCPWCKNQDVFAGKTVRWEWYSSKNGKTYDLIDTPLRNVDGSISKLEIFRDITQRTRAEEALRESEGKLSAMLQSLGDHVSMMDKALNILWANDVAKGLFGDDIIGKKCYEVYHGRNKPCEPSPCLTLQAFEDGQIHKHETRVQCPDGRTLAYACTASVALRDDEGNPTGVIEVSRDITERKRAEEELRRQRDFAEGLIDTAQAIVLVLDTEARIVRFNRYLEELSGYRLDEVRGKDWFTTFLPQSDWDRIRAVFRQALGDIQTRGNVNPIVTADGRQREIEWYDKTLKDADGNTVGLLAIGQDITERKQAEEALRESEELYSNIVESMSDGILVLDEHFHYRHWNRAMERISHVPREELVGKGLRPWDVFPHLAEKGVDEMMKEAMRGVVPEREDIPYRLPDGTEGFTSETFLPLRDADGRISGMVGVIRDVTERKRAEEALQESEEKYRHLFEQLNDAAFLADAETGMILDTNAQAEALLGRTRDEIIGIHQLELHPPGKSGEYRQEFAEHVALGRAADYDGEVLRKDGSVVPVTISAATLTLGGKQLILGLFHDTTDRQQLEEQLRQAQKMEAVGTLASGVAHDFNNLLTAIFGYTDLARATLPEGHPAAHSLEMVEQAARQAGGVSRSLLTFSRKAASRKSPVNFGEVLHQAVRFLRRVLPASIEVIEELSAAADLWGMADAAQIQQVLMNLAVNSRDAMPEGGRLRIRLAPGPAEALGPVSSEEGQPASTAVLVVEDTGVGMPPEVRSRIFEPFFTTKPRGQGTGLGMSVIHGIVTDHGGRIEVESEPQRGTRVTISLPCSVPSDADRREQAEPGGAGRGADHDAVIIVVEDDEHVRSIMCSTLRSEGYEAVPAGDGLEAAAALQTHAAVVRLVLLDLDLPRRSGVSVLREIRETKMDIPVIVVTGGVGFDPAEHLDGSERLLLKPFRMSELVSLVAQTLADSRIELGVEP